MPSTTTALSSAALSFSDVVKKRRSVYSYLDVPVPTAIVEDAIAMAVLAPNHYRTRPWRFFVFVGAGRARLAAAYKAAALRLGRDVPKATQRVYDAPVMVAIACIPTTSNPRVVRSEEEFATAAAAHTFMLALTSAGVDSLLTTGDLAQSEEVRELVRMEGSDGKLMGVINVGYRDPERPLMARPAPDPTVVTTWYTSE